MPSPIFNAKVVEDLQARMAAIEAMLGKNNATVVAEALSSLGETTSKDMVVPSLKLGHTTIKTTTEASGWYYGAYQVTLDANTKHLFAWINYANAAVTPIPAFVQVKHPTGSSTATIYLWARSAGQTLNVNWYEISV